MFNADRTIRSAPQARCSSLSALAYPLLWAALTVAVAAHAQDARDGFQALFNEHCAVCHGEHLQGSPQGTPLAGAALVHGDSVSDIETSIAAGYPERGMPAWSRVLDSGQISSLAILIAERRSGYDYADFHIASELTVPDQASRTELHTFRLETVTASLDPLPYSIAALPDGSILLTEKMRGLTVISPHGEQSALVAGAPRGHDDAEALGRIGLRFGLGWLLDVAVHPDYRSNGWIYLTYGDRCDGCNRLSVDTGRPVSMIRLIRGRIRDNGWVDEEVIWQADIETYTAMTDMAVGGRLAFDPDGYVFMSLGMKGGNNHAGIQDLSSPYGKIHRMHDDGRIPADNPFIDIPGAIKTTWTLGHRSPQGLEFDPRSRELWGTEMGPRGGDEVNRLLPGHNYGWPLYSRGVNYDGTPVAYGKTLGIEFELDDIDQPVVDLTPSPAVSSFVIYDGPAFPGWRGNLIVGTLKATDLRRMVIEEDRLVHTETLLEGVARIRDVEVGAGGEIYLLLEHASGGQIVRMVPAYDAEQASIPEG
jgi:glucose/arabinose dehydrogenase